MAGDTFEAYLWLPALSGELGTEEAASFAASAEERWDAIDEAEDSTEEQVEASRKALVHVLRQELADLL
jgi:hypothetical protein